MEVVLLLVDPLDLMLYRSLVGLVAQVRLAVEAVYKAQDLEDSVVSSHRPQNLVRYRS